MRKSYRLLTYLRVYLTLLGFLILAFVFFYFSNGLNIKNLLQETPVGHLTYLKPVPATQLNSWIAWWDEEKAVGTLKKNPKLASISPLWYKIDKQGNLQTIPHFLEGPIKDIARQSNIKLIPAITNDFDPERVSKVINNTDILQNFMEKLANLAAGSNYQGFDIDWEEINPQDQQAFSLFIQKLSGFLHTYNLALTVSVHPQTGQPSDRAVARAYNLAKLSQNSDALKIMAYDIHNQNSAPGAVIPFGKLIEILDYTKSVIPAEKTILGIPGYGYDWAEGQKGTAVSFAEASDRIKKYDGSIQRDTESYSLAGNYISDGKKHTIWFEDAQTIGKIIEKARSYGIYRFSFWRLGVEDPAVWTKLPF